ncbi:MAG: oligosaccharide deacetylase, partial [Chthonomonadales bacterium]|nr:oligosaccharide deacetylase [Chthonomonadales bacterium]
PAHFDKKLIALTFDDGPDPQCTPQVLDILAKYNAHATFFVVGVHIPGHEKLLQRMIAEGHVVGNHTYSHPTNVSAVRARLEISRTEALIVKATGQTPTCFRPPYGKTNTALVAQAKQHGYGVFLWTIDPGDTRGNGTRSLIRGVLSAPECGDILLLHDGIGHQASVDAVEPILEALSAKGWQFVTLPEMMVAWDTFRKTHPKSLLPHKTILSSTTKTHHKTKAHHKKRPARKSPAKAKRAPKAAAKGAGL